MTMTQQRYCPSCGEQREFTQAATTNLNIGLKVKWRCEECGHQSIQIGTEIDTATA